MKKEKTVDCDALLEAMLAEKPIAPSADFSRRICDAIADEKLDALFRKMPAEISPDFSERVMEKITGTPDNVASFPRRGKVLRFLRSVAAGTAACAALGLGIFSYVSNAESGSLSVRVAQVLAENSDLAEIVEADDCFSYDELIAASQILTILNENPTETAEIFAYYEN